MPPKRCVVQNCSNVANSKGISLHFSPQAGKVRDQWVRFVRTHRANFNPTGRFGVCSEHFDDKSFQRAVYVEGSSRRIVPGAIPTIWKKGSEVRSDRDRRKVSHKTEYLCL